MSAADRAVPAAPLAAVQRRFAAALTAAQAPAAAAAQPPAGVDVYREAYRVRLREALASNYPILRRTVGDEAFASLAAAYLDRHPSRRASIRWFGDALPAFMAGAPGHADHPALVDLARMEWALGTSFDGADAAVLDAAGLQAVAAAEWPGLRFAAHPSLQWLDLDWAVEAGWRALSADEDAVVDAPLASAHVLIVWRRGLDSRWRSLDAAEAELLRAVLDGAEFAAVCVLAAAQDADNPAARAAALLRRWVDDGLFAQRA